MKKGRMNVSKVRVAAAFVASVVVLGFFLSMNMIAQRNSLHADVDISANNPRPAESNYLAQTIEVTEYQVTASIAHETTPTLGNDGTSDLVVYTMRMVDPDGTLGPGNIWYQRFKDGVLVGPAMQVTSGDRDDQLNDVSGDFIVYTSYDNTETLNGRIMLYQISTGLEQALGDAVQAREPRIHGTTVVWRMGSNYATSVKLFDLDWLGTPQGAITIGGPDPPTFTLEIGDRFVVWAEYIDGQFDIVAYDLGDGSYIQVTNTPNYDELQPSTSGPWIVWRAREDGAAYASIQARNMDTDGFRVIQDAIADNQRPTIDGDMVAFESDTQGNMDVYLHELSTGLTFQVTSDPSDQYLNHIHGNLISYVDQRFGTEDVFVSTWRIIPTPHAPIYINDNTDFTTQGFPGLGTVDQPYVIAHLYIESNDNTLIEIENTDAFFIIRDCILDGVDCLFSGLILTSVTNGWIVGNEVRNCRNGIGLQYSSSNVIEYNHVENNHNIGIFAWNSDGNHLYRNTAFDSGYCGFTCTYGSGNTLVENSASRSTQLSWTATRGFMLSESSDNDLIQNTAHNCERGIFLAYDSTSNTLSGNTVTLCKYGFYLQDSPSNIIDGLEGAGKIEGYNVELKGIFIHNSDGVTVRDYWIEGFAIGIHVLECTEGTITVNHIRDNGVAAVALTDTSKITIERNIFSENMLGISLTESSSSNSIYLNLFMDNKQQVLDNGLNVWSFRESLGNFWSNYFGRDGNTDGIGDTDLPHEGVDWYPLMDPSIPMRYGQLPVGDDWWLYASYLIWRGGWSPVDIRVTDEQGRILSEDLNEIGLNAWFIEDDQWEPGTTMVMAIIAVGPMSPYETQQYTFEMTALENLDYSMEWFVSYGDVANELGGEVLFRESVENVALAVGETRLVELKIAQNPDGSVVVPEYTFSGVLEPINADGTSVFKRGRTIPVKFQLFDDAGLPVSTAQATIEVAKVSDDVVGTFEEGSSTSAADTGNVFRFDPEAQQYIFNLGTKTLETGTYVLRITLDDGQIFEVRFALR